MHALIRHFSGSCEFGLVLAADGDDISAPFRSAGEDVAASSNPILLHNHHLAIAFWAIPILMRTAVKEFRECKSGASVHNTWVLRYLCVFLTMRHSRVGTAALD